MLFGTLLKLRPSSLKLWGAVQKMEGDKQILGRDLPVKTNYSLSEDVMGWPRLGALPKEPATKQAMQADPTLWDEATVTFVSQEELTGSLWQSPWMGWGSSGPAEHRHSLEWSLLPQESQTLAGLPEQFGRLNVTSPDQPSGPRQTS